MLSRVQQTEVDMVELNISRICIPSETFLRKRLNLCSFQLQENDGITRKFDESLTQK